MTAGHDGRDKSQLCSPYPFILLGKYFFSFPVPKVIIRCWSSRTSYFYGKKKYAHPISLTPTLCSSLNEFRPKAAHQVLSTPLNGRQWASERGAGQRVRRLRRSLELARRLNRPSSVSFQVKWVPCLRLNRPCCSLSRAPY